MTAILGSISGTVQSIMKHLRRLTPKETPVTEEIDSIGKMLPGHYGFTVPWAVLVESDEADLYYLLWLQPNYEVVPRPTGARTLKVICTRRGFVCDLSGLNGDYRWTFSNCWKNSKRTGSEPIITKVINAPVKCKRVYWQATLPEAFWPKTPASRTRAANKGTGSTSSAEEEHRYQSDGSLELLKTVAVLSVLSNDDSN